MKPYLKFVDMDHLFHERFVGKSFKAIKVKFTGMFEACGGLSSATHFFMSDKSFATREAACVLFSNVITLASVVHNNQVRNCGHLLIILSVIFQKIKQ